MPNPENLKGKGFDVNPQNINKNGRPVSFKKQYSEMLNESSGGIIWVDENKVHKKEGKIGFKLSRIESMLARVDRLATGKNDRVALDAIKFLWEQFDGKASQPVDHTVDLGESNLANLTDTELKQLAKLQGKIDKG